MTRSKHILALLVSLVALVAIAPAASAGNGADDSVEAAAAKVRFGLVEPNPRCKFC